jgi:sugar phosphate isomerase/epimerase
MANQLGQKGATFKDLWRAFNSQPGKPCSNPTFTNQCAIRVSQALMDCGIDLSGFRGTRCWNDDGNYNRRHIIRAEEFAKSLKGNPLVGMAPMETAEPGKFQSQLDGKTGIIFFKDYWQRQNETPANRSGDHIDLWNMNKTTGYWWSWSRDFAEWMTSSVSDRNNSREIWFWRIS